jgi:cell wall-associated NlpC family hydrolase
LLGIPYLWGGTSSRGFDCSGLIQTIYRLGGLLLPRDSDQQAEFGRRRRSRRLESLRTGDLLFFGKPGARISHVGMFLPDGLFLHASGQVRVSSVIPDHPLYESKLASQWRFTKNPIV